MESYSFSARVRYEDLRKFNYYTSFRRIGGFFPMILGLVVLILSIWRYQMGVTKLSDLVFMILFAVVFVVYPPIRLDVSAKNAIKANPIFAEPIHYELDRNGIGITTKVDMGEGMENSSNLPWDAVYKVARTRDAIYIYSDRIHAFVIPLSEIENKADVICGFFREQLEEKRLVNI